jgi:site-specific DNA-cytosine methylase
MLSSLDLFTGCGGISHGLRGICEAKGGYCEVEPTRIRTINNLFVKGLLHKGPIHTDVRKLDGTTMRGKIDMVVGGWPCRGFSTIGKRNGFNHPQSALFVEFARLVDEIRPKFVLQENVPGVCGPSLDDVIASFEKSGYDATWMVLPGYAVGAHHSRKRWFCLAVRKDVREFTLKIAAKYERHDWSKNNTIPRMQLSKETWSEDKVRLSILGNSVIPDVVRLAFMLMFTGFTKSPDELWNATELELVRPAPTGIPLPVHGPSRYYGSYIDGVVEKINLPAGIIPRKTDLGLVLVPGSYVHDGPLKAVSITESHSLPMWGTPRGGCLGPSNVLAKRSKHDLYTSIRFERNTPDELRGGVPNVRWVESLMGYNVENWTEMAAPPPPPPPPAETPTETLAE